LILFSGKNVKACIIRWLAGGLVPFRMPVIATKERRILAVAMSYGVPYKAYGYNNLGVEYLPAPPIESAAVNTDFGVAPLDLLGKVFAYTFKPAPIGGRSVSLSGSLSVEFLARNPFPRLEFGRWDAPQAAEPRADARVWDSVNRYFYASRIRRLLLCR
jgi:hypothetical protein